MGIEGSNSRKDTIDCQHLASWKTSMCWSCSSQSEKRKLDLCYVCFRSPTSASGSRKNRQLIQYVLVGSEVRHWLRGWVELAAYPIPMAKAIDCYFDPVQYRDTFYHSYLTQNVLSQHPILRSPPQNFDDGRRIRILAVSLRNFDHCL